MNYRLKEALLGIAYGVVTMLFMIGALPWELVSRIIGCIVAVLAIFRIRNKLRKEESVTFFTVSYMAIIVVSTAILNSLSIAA